MKKTIIGVFGGSDVPTEATALAHELGAQIAANGWVTLIGGNPTGVMEAALRGAAEAGGETIGILMGSAPADLSPYVTIPISTNAGLARDYTNILTSDVAVFVGPVTAGALIEVAYALKTKTPIILLEVDKETVDLIETRSEAPVVVVTNPEAAIVEIDAMLSL